MKFGFDADTLDAVWIFCNNIPRINIIFFFFGFYFTASMPVLLIWSAQKNPYYILPVNDTYYNFVGIIVTFAAMFWSFYRKSKTSLTKFINTELNLVYINRAKFTMGVIAFQSYIIFINLLPYTLGFFIVRFVVILTGVTGQNKPIELVAEFLWIISFQVITYLWIYMLRVFWQLLQLSIKSRSNASFIYFTVVLFLFIQSSWKIGSETLLDVFGIYFYFKLPKIFDSHYPEFNTTFPKFMLETIENLYKSICSLDYQRELIFVIILLFITSAVLILQKSKASKATPFKKNLALLISSAILIGLYNSLTIISSLKTSYYLVIQIAVQAINKAFLFVISMFFIVLNLATCPINTNISIFAKACLYSSLLFYNAPYQFDPFLIFYDLMGNNIWGYNSTSIILLPEIGNFKDRVQYLDYINQLNPFFYLAIQPLSILCQFVVINLLYRALIQIIGDKRISK